MTDLRFCFIHILGDLLRFYYVLYKDFIMFVIILMYQYYIPYCVDGVTTTSDA